MKNIKIEVNPKIELVQVLILLSDRQKKTCQCLNNQYYDDQIRSYFSSYSDHPAVIQTQNLIDTSNFIHIKPLRAVLNLQNLLDDKSNPLHEWSVAVNNFIKQTDFLSFFESNANYYASILNKIIAFKVEDCLSYTEDFFHKTFDRFNLIICPIAGNYGFVIDVPEKDTAYTVRCEPINENDNEISRRDHFIKGVIHEFAHCFVNPIVESHKENLIELKPFFDKHTNMPSCYNVDYAVMNEYFVRAYTDYYMMFIDSFHNFDIKTDLERQRKNFPFLDKFIGYIEEYAAKDIPFEQFYLDILRRLK